MRTAAIAVFLLVGVPAGVFWWTTSVPVSAAGAVAATIPMERAVLTAEGFRDIRCMQTPRTPHGSWPHPINWKPADALTFECAATRGGVRGWIVGLKAGRAVRIPLRPRKARVATFPQVQVSANPIIGYGVPQSSSSSSGPPKSLPVCVVSKSSATSTTVRCTLSWRPVAKRSRQAGG